MSRLERFLRSCFEMSFDAARDGLDRDAGESLSAADQQLAADRILAALPDTLDDRPFEAAGLLRLRDAPPILHRRLTAGFPAGYESLAVAAADALRAITGWAGAPIVLADVLRRCRDNQWARMRAIDALARMRRDSVAISALRDAIEDEDTFIGFLAISALQEIFEDDSEISRLLARLRETQIEPHRELPQYVAERREVMPKLRHALRRYTEPA